MDLGHNPSNHQTASHFHTRFGRITKIGQNDPLQQVRNDVWAISAAGEFVSNKRWGVSLW